MTWTNSNRKRYENIGYTFTKYGDTFNVKINDIPKHSEVNITTVCDICGKEKTMTLHNYNIITKNGMKQYRCRNCFLESKIIKYSDIVKDMEDSEYKLLTPEKDFVNGNTYIKYLCPIHGEHKMRASNFHNGKRCPECSYIKLRQKFSFDKETVYNIIKDLGGKLLNKDDYINNSTQNLQIICPRCHKNVIITSLKHFQQHGGQVCHDCRGKESIGEQKIRTWLEDKEINFTQEMTFPDCKDLNLLRFDFYLPDQNTIIEFDGEQHFKEKHYFNFCNKEYNNSITSYTKYHDFLKNEYCKSNSINLIRIPYTQLNNINKILEENIN